MISLKLFKLNELLTSSDGDFDVTEWDRVQ